MDQPPANVRPRIVVVGACASGKSTLVEGLVAHGFDAYVCAQEHSEVADLWKRLDPEALIYLAIDLETLRSRRGPDWPESIYVEQIRRLSPARQAATFEIDTAENDRAQTLLRALEHLRQRGD